MGKTSKEGRKSYEKEGKSQGERKEKDSKFEKEKVQRSQDENYSEASTASSEVLKCVSPAARRRGIRRIKLSNTSTPVVTNSFRLD